MAHDFALTDAELCRFLDVGYHIVDISGIPETTHNRLFESADALYAQRAELTDPRARLDTIADNLHVRVPALREAIESDALVGALTSVLGPRHFRYGHSYIHLSGSYDQSYHKDSPLPWGTRGGLRSHRPNWAMVFYYPQAVTLDMGPTEILPGTQYWNVDRENTGRTEGEDRLDANHRQADMNALDEATRDQRLAAQLPRFDRHVEPLRRELPKGSLVLVHFDLFHRGVRRVCDSPRYMYKFWYARTTEPDASAPRRTIAYDAVDCRRQALVAKQAAWLGLDVTGSQAALATEPAGEQEADRMASAHAVTGDSQKSLVSACVSGSEAARRSAMYALAGRDEETRTALPDLLDSDSLPRRRCAAFLLGELSAPQVDDVLSLIALSCDADTDLRMTAMNAIGRALRRRIANGEPEIPDELCNEWARLLPKTRERAAPSGLAPSGERQCLYVALLNIVSSLAEVNAPVERLDGIAVLVCERVFVETDRYAKSTALECVARLAEMGHQQALAVSLRLLREERWSAAGANA